MAPFELDDLYIFLFDLNVLIMVMLSDYQRISTLFQTCVPQVRRGTQVLRSGGDCVIC